MYEYACTVDRVVDGDTVDVVLDLGFDVSFFSRVRLYGIDTPESRTRDKDEKARGLISKKFLQEALADQEVVIKTKLKDSRGKYGRVLGELWVDEVNINQTIAAVTPTPKDDAAVAWAYKIIDMIALNFGKAKDTGTAE